MEEATMEAIATVTARGQVTIPAAIRRHLGITTSDQVAFVVDGAGAVQVRPVRATWEDYCGSVPPIPGRETEDLDIRSTLR